MSRWRLVVVLLLAVVALAVAPSAAAAQPPSAGSATLELVTVPAVPEARFLFDGQELVTDAGGVARALVPTGSAPHTLQLVNPAIELPGNTAEFVRWWGHGLRDEGFNPAITDLRVRRNVKIQVGFRMSYEVTFAFADQLRNPVGSERVSAIALRNDTGQTEIVPRGQPARLTGVRPVLERSALIAKSATYSVQSIEIDGSNAVTAGEQRFAPAQEQAIAVTVPLQSVRFRAHDLLLGSPIGKAVEMTYPDGRVASVPLDPSGEVGLTGLVRGSYKLRAEAPGYAPVQPVELSRSQTVNLRVLTYGNMAILGGSAALLLGGLFLGRRYRRRVMDREEQAT